MAYVLPPLPYPKEALEPFLDAATMEIHHDKHHAAYVTNVNKALAGKADLEAKTIEQLVSNLDSLELQLRRQLDEKQGGTIRNTDPAKIPAGYRDAVAEYYRKLSGGGH